MEKTCTSIHDHDIVTKTSGFLGFFVQYLCKKCGKDVTDEYHAYLGFVNEILS